MNYWQNKVALVTGASSGLGLAIAEALARSGATLVIAARREQPLEAAADRLRRQGAKVLALPVDVTHQNEVERMVDQTIENFGRLDVLVNNVGRSARGAALDTTPDDFQAALELNLLATVRCTRAAVPHLLEARGHLVNIGSLASKVASRFMGAYPASKFALAAYTQQLRLELGPQGLHVLLVCPGPIARDLPGDATEASSRYADQAAGLPDSAQKPGAGVKLGALDPGKLAQQIVRACERRKIELVVPGRARLLFAIAQLSPRLGDWLVRKMT